MGGFFMEILSDKSFLVIEKVKRSSGPEQPLDMREFVARVPLEDGEHHTEKGVLNLSLHGIDSKNRMKMVLRGEVVPTVQKRGKQPQFKRKNEGVPRRVVELPYIPGGIVKQDLNPQEYLLFRREVIVPSVTLFDVGD
jgi:hypothetical protein